MRSRTIAVLALLVALGTWAACSAVQHPLPSGEGGAVTLTPTSWNGWQESPSEPTPQPTEVSPTAVFAYSSAESLGLSPDALGTLAAEVTRYFEDGLVVGAELVVIKDRLVVLHEAIGWKDREDSVPMERNTLFNIRSMTKPVLGTIIQMLVDEGKLSLDDTVAKYLTSFAQGRSSQITIEHLLTHRSGLPLTLLSTLTGYAHLQQIADEAGQHGPDLSPGSRFQYSDAGSDVLGAVAEKAAELSLDALYLQRVLEPLGMRDTLTLVDKGDPRAQRISSSYMGFRNNWTRFWSPDDEPIYPFAMGSQSLYCTPLDYARFLALWMDGGKVGDAQLLSPEAIQRALTPVSEMKQLGTTDQDYPTEFPDTMVYYGQMWELYMQADGSGQGVVAFGHSGSDGTAAWVWPDQDLMVLYFTQSRGGATAIRLEAAIDQLLLHPGTTSQAAEAPEELEAYLGTYTAHSGPLMNREYMVIVRNGRLALDLPEGLVVDLEGPDDAGEWRLAIDPRVTVSFVQDRDGQVTALRLHQAGETLELPRGTALPEPALDVAAVQDYLGFYRDELANRQLEVVIHNGRLAILQPESSFPLELYPPDEDGKWALRADPTLSISFDRNDEGKVVSFTVHSPAGEAVRPRVEP